MNIRFSVPATQEGITQGADQITSFLEAAHAPVQLSYHLGLAYEELATNIVKYGYEYKQATEQDVILISIELSGTPPDASQIRIEDHSHPYNPFEQPPQSDIESAAEDRAIGGLGIHLLRKLASHVSYERHDDKNITILAFKDQDPAL